MKDRKGIVKLQGTPLTLQGPELKAGDRAPAFTVIDKDLKEAGLKDFKGKIKLISVTPSLDTPVCEIQARKFNEEAARLTENVAVLNISMDLPFAIGRFCALQGIEKVRAFSDHRAASFGEAYGVLVKELRLLARSIFVIDEGDVIRYVQIVPELSEHPDYDKAMTAVKDLLKKKGS